MNSRSISKTSLRLLKPIPAKVRRGYPERALISHRLRRNPLPPALDGHDLLSARSKSHAPYEPRAPTPSHAGRGSPGRKPKGTGMKSGPVLHGPQDGGNG